MRERHADRHPREAAPRGAADEDEQHEMRHRGHEVDQARNNRVDTRATDRRGDRKQQRDDSGRHRRHETDRKRDRETGASDMKCCGFLIRDEDETIYFSADASELSDDILQQFKQGKIQVIYHDCTFLTKESPSHCSLKRLCEYIPPEMRNRVYCMHFGGDFMSQIKEAGFQVVTSV